MVKNVQQTLVRRSMPGRKGWGGGGEEGGEGKNARADFELSVHFPFFLDVKAKGTS